MRISDIRNIIVISEFKNFNKSSAYLHISQPSLSQSVKRLEASLGCQLFLRTKKSVSLTPDGEIFVREGLKILKIYDQMRNTFSQNERKGDPIRIAAASAYARYYFPEIFKTFKQLHPNVELNMVEQENKNRYQSLIDHEVDFAVMRKQEIPETSFTPLFEEHLFFAVPTSLAERKKDYIYKSKGEEYIKIEGFEGEPFLSYPSTTNMSKTTMEVCLEAGFIPNIVYESYDARLLTNLVSSGMGVGIVAELATADWKESDTVRFFRIDSAFMRRSYVLCWSSSLRLSQDKTDLIDIIKNVHANKKHSLNK